MSNLLYAHVYTLYCQLEIHGLFDGRCAPTLALLGKANEGQSNVEFEPRNTRFRTNDIHNLGNANRAQQQTAITAEAYIYI
jgi:hypothetical protein